MKPPYTCGHANVPSNTYYNKAQRKGFCKTCANARTQARRAAAKALREEAAARERASIPPEHKRCRVCGEIKPFAEFHRDKCRTDGYCLRCKGCSRRLRETISMRSKVMEGLRLLAKRYETSLSAAMEMLVLDALEDEEIRVPNWGGRIAESKWQ